MGNNILNLSELESGREIESIFAVQDKQAPRSYQNGTFFTLQLGNRTGEVRMKYWGEERENVQNIHDKLSVGDVVRVRGIVKDYQGKTEISINPDQGHLIEAVENEDYNSEDFLPTIDKNPEHLFSEISRRIRNMDNTYLKELCMNFYGDSEIAPILKEMPAAKSYHHNRIGGYIEHIHETMELAETFCGQHPQLDKELLLTGVFLHDIGKMDEYEYGAAIDFTDEGRLLGHIPMGDHMVTNAIDDIDGFPENLKIKVRHMILSHHGRKEWGSAVEPRTKEAIVLHEVEHVDSKVSKVIGTFREHQGSEDSGVFDSSLNQYIYLK